MHCPKLHWQSREYPGTPSPPSTPVAEYPRTPELHWQSRDHPGTPSPPSTPVAELTPELHRQSQDYPRTVHVPSPTSPLWRSIPVPWSYTGSPGIIPDFLPPHHPCGGVSRYAGVTLAVLGLSQTTFPHITPVTEYPGTLELHWQSWDYPRLPSPTSPLWRSILVRRSYTGSPGIILGLLPLPSTPVSEYPRMPELHQWSWDYPGTPSSRNPRCRVPQK